MKKLMIFLYGVSLFIYGCTNTNIYNLTEDYFPIQNDHRYIFTNDNDSLLLIIEKDAYNIADITVSGLWIEDSLIYIYKDETGIYTYIEEDSTFLLWIPFPLVDSSLFKVYTPHFRRNISVTKDNERYYIEIEERDTSYQLTLEKDKGITQWIYQ